MQTLFYSTNPLFPLFSIPHLALLALFFGATIWMVRHADFIRKPNVSQRIRITLIVVIIVQQFLLYGWYYANHAFHVLDALPLYPCRLSTLLLLVLLIRMNERLYPIVFYWGIVGAVLAMLSPDTEGIGFPNVMFLQFFMGHGALLIGTVFLAITSHYEPTRAGLKTTFRFSLLYFVAILTLNAYIGSNYAYLNELPPSPFLEGFPGFPYHVPFLLGTMLLLFYSMYVVHKLVYERRNEKTTPSMNS